MPTFPHVTCSNGPNGDMFMNYMDYVDDRAMVMFTAGQLVRANATLDGPRASILTAAVTRPNPSGPVVAWAANRLDAFVIGTDSALYHKAWDGSAWQPSPTAYESLGGIVEGPPEVVSWGPNRLDIFVRGTDQGLYHKWWSGSAWGPSVGGYENMGGKIVGKPKAVAWGPNRLDVFAVGTDHQLYHKAWNGSAWSPSLTGYEPLGGIILGDPEAVAWGANRLDIFVVGTDHAVYHKCVGRFRLGDPRPPVTKTWAGSFNTIPKVVAWGPNRLDIFAVGTDSALYHKAWNGSAWFPSLTGWGKSRRGLLQPSRGGVLGSEPARRVSCSGTDSALYHKAWNGAAWRPSRHRLREPWAARSRSRRRSSHGARTVSTFRRRHGLRALSQSLERLRMAPSATGYESLGGIVTELMAARWPRLPGRPAQAMTLIGGPVRSGRRGIAHERTAGGNLPQMDALPRGRPAGVTVYRGKTSISPRPAAVTASSSGATAASSTGESAPGITSRGSLDTGKLLIPLTFASHLANRGRSAPWRSCRLTGTF